MNKDLYATVLGRFRMIAICEGISFLALLGIAMPLKYVAGIPEAVDVMGWIHGLLFIAYLIVGLNARTEYNWPLKKTAIAFAASVVPFGPFILDKKMLREEA